MSAFKGTSGPWHIEHYSRGSCEVRISRPVGSNGMGPVAYALMDLAGAMTDERIAEMKANARLIAAAPDLLEALEAYGLPLTGDYRRDCFEFGDSEVNREMARRAAIAKATGEQA